MSHKTIETLAASCPKIEEVVMMMNDKITAESFRNMKSLKTLAISISLFIQEAAGELKRQSSSRLLNNFKNWKVYQ